MLFHLMAVSEFFMRVLHSRSTDTFHKEKLYRYSNEPLVIIIFILKIILNSCCQWKIWEMLNNTWFTKYGATINSRKKVSDHGKQAKMSFSFVKLIVKKQCCTEFRKSCIGVCDKYLGHYEEENILQCRQTFIYLALA